MNSKFPLRVRNVKLKVILCIVLIMFSATLLCGIALLILYSLNMIPINGRAALWVPLVSLACSFTVAATVSSIISHKVLTPINDIVEASGHVAQGDFSARVSLPSVKEDGIMGTLVTSFNSMICELAGIELFRKDFVNTFSHEFKTPIVSIKGFAKQLQKPELTQEVREQYAQIIIDEAERLSQMASNVLLLTKIENTSIIADKQTVEVDEQLRRAVLLLEKAWSEKNISIDMDAEPAAICANQEMLMHVWTNLLSNAVKFTPNGGKITVSCALLGDVARIGIRDNGIGMSRDTVEHAFDKFYQYDKSHAAAGTGLGLTLVKRLVEMHKGSIEVVSSPGDGSEFIITLPAV